MIRWLLYRFIPFYFVLICALAGAMLLLSETGLNWLWHKLEPKMPQQLQIEAIKGRLLGRIQIQGLRWENEYQSIQLQQAWLDWSPSALLRSGSSSQSS